ncbi:MFS general substrate transporter [Lindgomyces ingoldianus]|uniref:MFS general substrate transporter n=1 Tax=Lindgomyces ingoldianus TaxID=673940 RepID=A0ACB6R3H7_9PLEO|nr:MFS general substrate transporter [Lindgomyces ingoldianus]KAF2473731.1 MFS general substrate transporter [Lindgomyces ingoldianus]
MVSSIEEAKKGVTYNIERAPLGLEQLTAYEATTDEATALDKAVNLKLDCIVVLILAIDFILCGIDKTNIGYVATTNMVKDANLKPDDIPDSVSLFSVTFITLQPVSTAIGRRVGPKYWIAFMMICWGSVCMAHAGVQNRCTLITLRLLLGAFEAGFVPTSFYYMSTIYPKYSLGFRLGLFAGMYSIAGAFAGLIAYGIFQIRSSTLQNWQLLFLIEGGLSLSMAVVTVLVLPAKLESAWFFKPAEAAHAVARMELDVRGASSEDARGKTAQITKRDIFDSIKDWKKLITVVFNVLATLPVSAFSYFMPLIVHGLGYHGIKASLMSVSPFVVGACGLFAFVWSSDHFKERSIHTASSMILAIVGLIVVYVSETPKIRYAFVHICLAGAFTAGPLIVAWLAGNTPEKGMRAIIIGINGWSNLAGVIAGQLFKPKHGPTYRYPLLVTMILIAIGACGFLSIRILLMCINRKRAQMISTWTVQEFEEESESSVRRGDQKPTFKYGY